MKETASYMIGGIKILIASPIDLGESSIYTPFKYDKHISDTSSYDIYIEIKHTHINLSKLLNIEALDQTYFWTKQKDLYYLIFGQRTIKLKDTNQSDLWVLQCRKDFKHCCLYIPEFPNTDRARILNEIVVRPWMQRLIIAYSFNTNKIVFHGALANIHNKGVLFLGESGAGKSTMCDILSKNHFEVIADDRFILSIENNNMLLGYGTPWNIKNQHYSKNAKILINNIFFISHGNNKINFINNTGLFLKHCLQQIMHSNLYSDFEILQWKFKNSLLIQKRLNVYDFSFIPDKSAISVIENL